MLEGKFSFIDFETTGMDADVDRVIDVGIIRVENGQIVDELNSLVYTAKPIPPFVQEITGISQLDLADQPEFTALVPQVIDLIEDTTIVAHNAKFDYTFLRSELQRSNIYIDMPYMCTVKLSRRLFPLVPKHNLDAIVRRYDLEMNNRHRAYDDAHALVQFMKILPEHVDMPSIIQHSNLVTVFPKNHKLNDQQAMF